MEPPAEPRFPVIRIVDHNAQDFLVDLAKAIVFENTLVNVRLRNLPQSLKETALRFIANLGVALQDAIAIEDYCKQQGSDDPMLWKSLLLLRGLIAHKILFTVLKEKRWKVDYGLDLRRSQLAVPYRAMNSPSLRSNYAHPDVLIITTCLSYYYGGMDDSMISRAIEQLFKTDNPDLIYSEWLSEVPTVPGAMRDLRSLALEDADTMVQILQPNLRYNKRAIDFFLNNCVFSKEAKAFPEKLSSSGWDLAAAKDHLTTGFSGTNDSRFLLPTPIVQVDTPEQRHTNAMVIKRLLRPENATVVPHHDRISSTELLKLIMAQSPMPKVLLDVGAQVLDCSNGEFVEKWLALFEDNDTIKAAVYFDDDDTLRIMSKDRSTQAFSESSFVNLLGECVVFLDDAHTRGTDLKLPPCQAAVTLGPRLTKDKLVQAFLAVPDSLRNTTMKLPKGSYSVFKAILVTSDFAQTIVPSIAEDTMDQFLRPVEWLVSSRENSNGTLVAFSPYEVNELMPLFRQSNSKVTLNIFSPYTTELMTPLDDLRLFKLPPIAGDPPLPRSLVIPLNLFSGSLYLPSQTDYRLLCNSLRLYFGSVEALPEVNGTCPVNSCGFVSDKEAQKLWGLMGDGFEESPIEFLRQLIHLRRNGRSFFPSDMGQILYGIGLEGRNWEEKETVLTWSMEHIISPEKQTSINALIGFLISQDGLALAHPNQAATSNLFPGMNESWIDWAQASQERWKVLVQTFQNKAENSSNELPVDLGAFVEKAKSLALPRHPFYVPPDSVPPEQVLRVSPKKLHEVFTMSSYILSLFGNQDQSQKPLVVDIGAGQGYLSRSLSAHPNNFHVLAVDSDDSQTAGSISRRDWLGECGQTSDNVPSGDQSNNIEGGGIAVPASTGSLAHRTAHVGDSDSLFKILDQWVYDRRQSESSGGDGFPLSHEVSSAISAVGSLSLETQHFHLATQSPLTWDITSSVDRGPVGSSFAVDRRIAVLSPAALAIRKVTYRALLAKRLPFSLRVENASRSTTGPDDSSNITKISEEFRTVSNLRDVDWRSKRIGRLANSAYVDFPAFLRNARAKLKLDAEEDATGLESGCDLHSDLSGDERELCRVLEVFHVLRCFLGPIIESLVALDRYWFLRETVGPLVGTESNQGITPSGAVEVGDSMIQLVNLFDQSTGSLRNMALVWRE
ncbi:hypothetical protein FRC17_000535 [Serendipita sp. 399]|nr:hypothetical protein FRC17_000535 [Serendipita sp. 399]